MKIMNIELEEKIDYTLSITYRDDTTNLPVDITGYTAHLQVRGMFGSPYILLDLVSPTDIVLGGVTGNIDITFLAGVTDLQTQPLGWISGAYDLVLISPEGTRIKILKGLVTVSRSSTI